MDTKKLRQKILDFAIRGKLVPQDPNDEPAIELLRRINPDFQPCDNAHYRQLPKSWSAVPLGSICKLTDGDVINKTELPYLDVKSLRNQTYTTKDNGKFIKAGTTLILVDGENSGDVFYAAVDGYQGSTMKILNIVSRVGGRTAEEEAKGDGAAGDRQRQVGFPSLEKIPETPDDFFVEPIG